MKLGLATWHIALVGAMAFAGPSAAQADATGMRRILLAPPVDRDLRIDIRDERRLPNGGAASFASSYVMRFAMDGDGWQVSIRLRDVDCSGEGAICAAYRAAMRPMLSVERVLSLSRTLSIRSDTAAPPVGALGADNIALIVAAMDATSPGELGSAELREALFYADMAIPATQLQPMANGHLARHDEQGLTIASDSGGPPVTLVRTRHDEIDPATGLLVSARIITREAGDPQKPIISNRYWSLTEIVGP